MYSSQNFLLVGLKLGPIGEKSFGLGQTPARFYIFFQDGATSGPIKFYAYSTKESITGIIMPIFDMGSDVVTAATHFRWSHYGWGIMTLVFVALPGLVCGLAITIKGLRKKVSAQRIVNFSIILVALPFLYPFIQVFV